MLNAVVAPTSFLRSNHEAFNHLFTKSSRILPFFSTTSSLLLPLPIFLLTQFTHLSSALCSSLVLRFFSSTTSINQLLLTRRLLFESFAANRDCTPLIIVIISILRWFIFFRICKALFLLLLSRLTWCLCPSSIQLFFLIQSSFCVKL